MSRFYSLVEKQHGESNQDWLRRAVDAIPPELLLSQIVATLDEQRERRPNFHPEAWVRIGQLTGHGSGVATAICDKYRKAHVGEELEKDVDASQQQFESLTAENAALRAVLRELPGVWVDSTFEAKHIAARETARFAVESIIAIACKRRGVSLEDGK